MKKRSTARNVSVPEISGDPCRHLEVYLHRFHRSSFFRLIDDRAPEASDYSPPRRTDLTLNDTDLFFKRELDISLRSFLGGGPINHYLRHGLIGGGSHSRLQITITYKALSLEFNVGLGWGLDPLVIVNGKVEVPSEEKLWRDICNSTWTSISDPRVCHAISTFPTGYPSFFFDSNPATFHRANTSPPDQHPQSVTTEFISAVDLHYEKKLIFSKVEVTETVSKDFMGPPLLVELFNRKKTAPAPVKFDSFNDDFLSHLQQSMKLSWIMIDPTRKCAANLSSLKPVSVQRHYMADEAQLIYVTVLPGSAGSGHRSLWSVGLWLRAEERREERAGTGSVLVLNDKNWN
ncbi:hypothetical protein LguiB_031571 [Lonicera macranthoides]